MRLIIVLLIIPFLSWTQGDTANISFEIQSGEYQIETFRFYLSDLEFYHDSQKVHTQKNSYHLIDSQSKMNIQEIISVPFDSISFSIGIDSSTNVSGVMGGDLDPINGMYWAWQSGYINFKLEGKTNKSSQADHSFQFHIGGYSGRFATVQRVCARVNMSESSSEIVMMIYLEKLLDQVDWSKKPVIMRPCEEAVQMANSYQKIFKLKE